MTQKKTELENELESCLIEWANFYRDRKDFGLGYPSITPFHKIKQDGGILGNGRGLKPEPDNFVAEEMEQWITEMRRFNARIYPKSAKAIRLRYFSSRYTTNKELARRMGVSERMVMIYLRVAKEWLLNKLSIKKYLLVENF